MDFPAFTSIEHALLYLVPGLIIMATRARFTTGRIPERANHYVYYTVTSVIYHIFTFPLLGERALAGGPPMYWSYLIVLPALIGCGLGVFVWWDRPRRVLRRMGFTVVHPVDTAWDWKFAGDDGQWVLVTLTDGSRFGGWLGEASFISSDPSERDLYVERLYAIPDDTEPWVDTAHSIYVSADQIRTIEFWLADTSSSPTPERHDGTTQGPERDTDGAVDIPEATSLADTLRAADQRRHPRHRKPPPGPPPNQPSGVTGPARQGPTQ